MKRGPYKTRKSLLAHARQLRKDGHSYGSIGQILGVPLHTIRNWVVGIAVISTKWIDRKTRYPQLEECSTDSGRRNALIREHGRKCWGCKRITWLGNPIPLELNHKDGRDWNNVRDNLELLCPNCHALTPTYRGRNVQTWKNKTGTGARLATPQNLQEMLAYAEGTKS